MKPFRSNYTITQAFGVNKDYYKQFGLEGHEGLDLIPSSSDWTVLALAEGVVVKDDDVAGDPRTDAYGISVTIWHPQLKKATQYCHLESNRVSIDQKVQEGDPIGVMGATGNANGAHLHLNLFDVDDNGIRLNRDNGFLGGIDPAPFLATSEQMAQIPQKELDQIRADRDQHYNDFEAAKNTITNLNGIIDDKNRKLDGLNSDVDSLKKQVDGLTTRNNSLQEQAIKVPQLDKLLSQAEKSRDNCLIAQSTQNKIIAQLRNSSYTTSKSKALVAELLKRLFRVK